jgi:membrane protein implicated in regulation of membrane protease activity
VNGYFWMALAALAVLALSLVFDDVLDVEAGPDWVSLPVIAAVVAAFGLAAGAVSGSGGGDLIAVPVGLATGVAAGALTARFVAAAMRMPTDPPIRHADLAGRVGRVVTPIRPGRPGEVLVALGGTSHKLTAHASTDLALGAEVVVVEVTSPTSVVVASLGLEPQELNP